MTAPVSVVVDTNVFVASAFNAGSASRRITDGLAAGDLALRWNVVTRDETRRILRQIPRISWAAFESLYSDSGEFTGAVDTDRCGYVSGSIDREFLALAEAVDTCLISNDDDLLGPRHHARIPVFRPGEFVEWWRCQ